MTSESKTHQPSIDSSTASRALRDCVRRALCVRRARLHAVVAAAGIASVTPLALGAAFPAAFPLESLYPDGGGDGSQGFVLTGIDAGDRSGYSVSAAGDVNGDSVDDLVIGAYDADPFRVSSAGETYVVFGSTQGFPAIFPLETLIPANGGDGSRGFVLTGIDQDDESGFSVSEAGDVNGDGIDDLIIGAPNGSAGESYVVFGSTQGFPAVVPLASLYPAGGGDGSRGFVLTGIQSSDYAGYSVSAAGDVNGDGVDDLIVGAKYAETARRYSTGESYVVFGSTEGFPPVFPLERLFPTFGGDGSRGFVLSGINNQDFSGRSVSGAGDVNADGIDDLIIGAWGANPGRNSSAGESYVVFGSTQAFPAVFALASLFPNNGGDGSLGFVLPGASAFDRSGWAVSAAGDVNGDGIDDVIVGAFLAGPGGHSEAGATHVVFGSTQGFASVVPLASLYPAGGGDGSRGFVVTGIDANDFSGRCVSAAGDVNGDGIDDLMVGADEADPSGVSGAGESYVVFGSTQGFAPVLPLAVLYPLGGGDGSRGFVLTGIDQDDRSGSSVSAAGDVNGDGIDDLIIGARFADVAGESSAGESYVVFGRAEAP